MEELKTKADNLAEDAGDYFETLYKLAVLNVTEKTAGVASISVTALLTSFLVLFVLLFSGFGLSWWIGDALKNLVAGYFIVAGFYFVLIVLVLLFRKKYIFPFIRDFIIRKIYD